MSKYKTNSPPASPLLAEHVDAIRALGKQTVENVIEIGRRLTECKKLVGHGNWLPWLDRVFGWSERTARRFMQAHEFALAKSDKLADLSIGVSSLCLLAAPSTPNEARDEIIRRAQAGETIPAAEAKRIIADSKTSSKLGKPTTKPQPSEKSDESVQRKRKVPNLEPCDADEAAATLAAEDAADLRSIKKQVEKLQTAWFMTSEPALRKFVYRLIVVGEAEHFGLRPVEPSSDIGPNSTGEMALKDAEIAQLRNEKQRLEIKITGLEREIAELKAERAEIGATHWTEIEEERKPASDTRCSICHEKKRAVQRPVFICDDCVHIFEVNARSPGERASDQHQSARPDDAPPPDDGIPDSLRRSAS